MRSVVVDKIASVALAADLGQEIRVSPDIPCEEGVLIGTVGYWVGKRFSEAPNTTPSALELQALLAQGAASGCRTAVMEASSHALDQGRTEGLRFQAAVFSNLTRDHLDYHGTLAAYGAAKARLFAQLLPTGTAVVNAEDPWSARMARRACRCISTTRARWPSPTVMRRSTPASAASTVRSAGSAAAPSRPAPRATSRPRTSC